ncbi:MAG: hypothetical protein C6W55_12765 [Thermobacillus sp.]|uniref:putative sporulation protein YtxC n=1 Tax=Thermobacillus sp. TaxID=2108467 RepID=UPI000E36E4E4|nr:putative sporulation protein YtxC [Thermobacillus sp.]REK54100.1 MAG: hypothetical protein C6W55_12765 [Thermobacillus sp.]
MEIFEVRLSAASEDKLSELTRCLTESFADLHIDGRLETVPAHSLIVFRCADGAPDEKERMAIHSRAAEGMAEYVLTAVEPELIRIMIRKYYPCGDDDLERIAALCMQMLGSQPVRSDGSAKENGPLTTDAIINRSARLSSAPAHSRNGQPAGPEDADASVKAGRTSAPKADATLESSGMEPDLTRRRRKRHIASELFAYLQERPSLHLEGYITFRLDKYWEELAESAEAAVDEFVMDRQYREFIGLLNEFVGLQQPKVSSVNLVLKADGSFALYDESFRPMDPGEGGRLTLELTDEELNVEDMVVSCLIAISPREITLHARDPELPVVRTIEAIFAERVTVCAGCRSCRPLTGAALN